MLIEIRLMLISLEYTVLASVPVFWPPRIPIQPTTYVSR